MVDYDVVVVGGGPAGLTAAIYCARRKLKVVVVERLALGGQMLLTSEIGNWPGDKIVSGVDLAARMEDHAKSLGVNFLFDEVVGLNLSEPTKKLYLRDSEVSCSAVILATGGQHMKLKVKGEEEFTGRGVSYCATCDGPFFKGKVVAVVGGGNMALEDALYMNDVAEKVYVIANKFTAEEMLVERMKSSSVEVLDDELAEITGSQFVEKITLKSGRTMDVGGVFIAVGSKPSTELASDAGVKLDERGFIEVNKSMETNISGVYAAGDVTGGIPQISTAVGGGATAALKAYGYVKENYAKK
ncbi:MAG: FAD-dependent oxidoreductase [Candidatus Altiarchaeota archaeon]|nr:FAD-dependent oxidoreductase [Candidatus Altiarchaeota archaeon]